MFDIYVKETMTCFIAVRTIAQMSPRRTSLTLRLSLLAFIGQLAEISHRFDAILWCASLFHSIEDIKFHSVDGSFRTNPTAPT